MNALNKYKVWWAVGLFTGYGLASIVYLLWRYRDVFSANVIDLLMAILRDSGVAIPLGGIVLVVAVARIAQSIESSIKVENLSLHKFNANGEIDSPQELFKTAVDNCLDAGNDPKELVTILRERYQAKAVK